MRPPQKGSKLKFPFGAGMPLHPNAKEYQKFKQNMCVSKASDNAEMCNTWNEDSLTCQHHCGLMLLTLVGSTVDKAVARYWDKGMKQLVLNFRTMLKSLVVTISGEVDADTGLLKEPLLVKLESYDRKHKEATTTTNTKMGRRLSCFPIWMEHSKIRQMFQDHLTPGARPVITGQRSYFPNICYITCTYINRRHVTDKTKMFGDLELRTIARMLKRELTYVDEDDER